MEQYRSQDVISRFFEQGFYHVLEKIFLDLDPDSKAAARRVSRTWKNVVKFYFESPNPRYRSQICSRISDIWAKNSPDCQTHSPVYPGFEVVRPDDIVRDDLNLILSVLVEVNENNDVNGVNQPDDDVARFSNKIVILDSSDFSFVRDFTIENILGFKSFRPLSISLLLTEDQLLVNAKTSQGLMAHFNMDRRNNYRYEIVYQYTGIEETVNKAGLGVGMKKISRPVIGPDFVKYPIREHNYENCSVAFYRTLDIETSKVELSHTSMNTTLPYVDTVAVPASSNFIVREFNYKNDYLTKLGCYDGCGVLIWEIVKPRFYSNIVAVDADHAAVLMQAGSKVDGDRVDQIHLYKLQDGSLITSIDISFTEVIGKGHLDHNMLAMCVMTVSNRDVVVVDLIKRNIVFSVKESFNIDVSGSVICLSENKLVVAVENKIYSAKF